MSINTQPRKLQEPNESLHWISYNLKNLVKELEKITAALARIEERMPQKPGAKDDFSF